MNNEDGVSVQNYDLDEDEVFYIWQVKGNQLLLPSLPTSDPEVKGAVWNDNGNLKISAGA